MEIARDFDGHDLVFNSVGDEYSTGSQIGEVDARVGVERLYFLQKIARALRVALAAVLAEGFLNFRLRKDPLVFHRKAPFDVLEIALPVVEETVPMFLFDPQKGR